MTHSYAPQPIHSRLTRHALAVLRRSTTRHGISGQVYFVEYAQPRVVENILHIGEATVVYPDWMNAPGQRVAVGLLGQTARPVFSLMPWGTKHWREKAQFTDGHSFRLAKLDEHMLRITHPETRLKPLPQPYRWEVRLINPGKKHPRFEHIRVPA